MGKKRRVVWKFVKSYAFLSNFYPTPVEIDGVVYPTVEHYFQSMKATNPKDREWVLSAPTPGKARQRGRKIKLREDWHQFRNIVMRRGVYEKFTQYPELEKKLLDTDDMILVEGNFWKEYYWGCVFEKGTKRGKNNFGVVLMEVRKYLRETPPEKRSFEDFMRTTAYTIHFDCDELLRSLEEGSK